MGIDKVYFKGAYCFIEENGAIIEKRFHPDRALMYLLSKEIVFTNSRWWKDSDKDSISVNVNCSDVFAWACADAEDLPFTEIEHLYECVKKDPLFGSTIWCIIHRKEMPIESIIEKIHNKGIWDLNDLKEKYNLAKNQYDSFCNQRFNKKGEE